MERRIKSEFISSDPENIVTCLACSKNFPSSGKNLNEILCSDIFEVLCKYMQWSPPPSCQFNFRYDPFPFCDECKPLLVSMFTLHEQMEGIREKIQRFTISICSKVLNQTGKQIFREKAEKNVDRKSSIQEKCNYYRSLILTRFAPSVYLSTLEPRTLARLKRRARYENRHKHSRSTRSKILRQKLLDDDDDDVQIIENEKPEEVKPQLSLIEPQPALADIIADEYKNLANVSSKDRKTLINYLHKYTNFELSIVQSEEANNLTILYDGKYHYGCRDRNNDKWACIFCEERFLQINNLVFHLKYCPGFPPPNNSVKTLKHINCVYDQLVNGEFQCRRCQHVSTKLGMIIHLKTLHAGVTNPDKIVDDTKKTATNNKEVPEQTLMQRIYCCDVCSERFKDRGEAIKHKTFAHIKNLSNFVCKLCCKKFGSLGLLVAHKKVYSNGSCRREEAKIECNRCSKVFATNFLLSRHKLVHTENEIRPFACNFCKKSFKSKSAMRMHKAWSHLRHIDKKFECEVCGDKFDGLLLLSLHDKVHEEVFTANGAGKTVQVG